MLNDAPVLKLTVKFPPPVGATENDPVENELQLMDWVTGFTAMAGGAEIVRVTKLVQPKLSVTFRV